MDAIEPRLPLGKRFWALDPDERAALQSLFEDGDVARLILSLDRKGKARSVRLVDAAYWMKGCSSLGSLRFAAIVGLETGKGKSEYALMDLKEAVEPIAPAYRGARLPKDQGERVVTAAKALSPHLGSRMMPVHMLGRSLVLRELAPQDLKIEVEQFSQGQAIKAARYLAFVVAKAHARQLDAHDRKAWGEALDADRRGLIDAPSWLWESVVSLAGSHEAGYLEHCRRYALAA